MPKGRGSNERRRTERQKHPKDKRASTEAGYLKLEALYSVWRKRSKR